jgi:hypothetical protein
VTHAVLPVGASKKWSEAKDDAAKELASLTARIPVLSVEVHGHGERKLSLTIDGKAVAPAEGDHPVDPGKHALLLSVSGGGRFPAEVTVGESQHKPVAFEIPVGPKPIATTAPEAGRAQPPSQRSSGLLVVGVVTLSLGAAGLAVWGIAGGLALGKASEQNCVDAACEGDVGSLQAMRVASTAGFYAGVGLAAVGGTLLVVSTVSGKKTSAAVTAGFGRLAVRTTF